jgi:uncharacterized protein
MVMAEHKIVHIEFPAANPAEDATFYGELFGWKLSHDASFDYHMFQINDESGGGFNKLTDSQPGMGDLPIRPGDTLVYFSTDDIERDLAKVESLGGKILQPKIEIPGVGWFGIFADLTGNRVALYTGKGASA